MDAATKRSQAEKVRRRVDAQLKPFGFSRTKTSFWTRNRDAVIEFIHLHLFRYQPQFRIHLGIRVLNDTFDAPALNGPNCRDSEGPEFDETAESVISCAFEVFRYSQETALPWFTKWKDPRNLLTASDSPLGTSERAALEAALKGSANPKHERLSRSLLGVA